MNSPAGQTPEPPKPDWSPQSRSPLAPKVIAGAVVVAGLYYGRDILVPFALAALLGFVLDPMVGWLKRWRLPRFLAVAVVMLITVAVLGATSLFVGSQVVELSRQLPTYQTNIQTKLQGIRQSLTGRGVLDDASRMVDVVAKEFNAARRALDQPSGRKEPVVARVQLEPESRTAMQTLVDVISPALGPLGTAGMVMVFLVFILLERHDMRDRLLRLAGGNLHLSTDALGEAGHRVSRYLNMQLLVNLSYGLPMAAGLYLIGVPGALLWGLVAAMMRFVPYVGPVIATVFPLTMAFAVDLQWSMLWWTLGLVVTLELISNNLIEPWLYGASTGLSAVSIIVSAVFWTALWGPIGLILATPVTVCLAVMGRHIPQLRWLDILLGNEPVFDPATRTYQRLLAGDVEEAIEMATEQIRESSLVQFYSDTAVPVLKRATVDHAGVASVEHRHRVLVGMTAMIRDLVNEHASRGVGPAEVLAIGARWEVDALAADMLAHALSVERIAARSMPASSVSPENVHSLDLDGIRMVCLSYFSATPQAHIRYVVRRLLRRRPDLKIVVALWNATPALLQPGVEATLGVDAVAHSLAEVVLHTETLLHTTQEHEPEGQTAQAEVDEAQLTALASSGALESGARETFERAVQRVADIFDVPKALVLFANDSLHAWHREADQQTSTHEWSQQASVLCKQVLRQQETVVLHDLARDPRFSAETHLTVQAPRFFAGAPLRTKQGIVVGALGVMDMQPRELTPSEIHLLELLATETMTGMVADAARQPPSAAEPTTTASNPMLTGPSAAAASPTS
ncbi:MAG: AI-2E family transporter [Pseudomonadota bacterium]